MTPLFQALSLIVASSSAGLPLAVVWMSMMRAKHFSKQSAAKRGSYPLTSYYRNRPVAILGF